MAKTIVDEVAKFVPQILHLGPRHMWIDYDEEADVLYISFRKPQDADDSELRDDGIIVRYKGKEVVGLTILNAKRRKAA